MILKTKASIDAKSPQAIAGQKQEQNVAFYLRRAFKDHPQVLVINDFKFSFKGETAQIDHLIIYTYGFILIESKSIKGQVKVNEQGEWTRSYNNQWSGIPSPIKQVELQQQLLLQLLQSNREEILNKLLGIKQQGFKMRCWDHLCAISSEAIIDRSQMPAEVSSKLVKTEFLVDKLDEIMKLTNKVVRFINFTDTRPDFKQEELTSISQFIINQHIDGVTHPSSSANANPEAPVAVPYKEKPTVNDDKQEKETTVSSNNTTSLLSCKHCGETQNYTPMFGKFGYYIKCNQCTKNTPMKQVCPQCKSKNTKVQKRKETYTLNCLECGTASRLHKSLQD